MEFADNISKIMSVTRFLYPTLSPSEKKAAEYLLTKPQAVANSNLIDFAKHSGSSQASIIRLCKRIGVSGYAELKSKLAIEMVIESHYETGLGAKKNKIINSNMIDIINWVFKGNIQILKETFALATDEYNRAFEAILNTRRLSFFGIGDSMIPCMFAHFKFSRIGYDCFSETDCDLQIIRACNMTENDVVIAVSHSGNTKQVNSALKIAHEKEAKIICITKRDRSEMLKYCDIKLFTATPDMNVGQETVARRLAEQAILEALYFGVLQAREDVLMPKLNESSEQMKVNKL